MMKRCSRCKVERPLSEFGKKGIGLQCYCKPCHSAYNSEWYERNAEYSKKYHLDLTRRTSLHTIGGFVRGLNKRPYTEFCEICGVKREKGLQYHHWDDDNFSKGIWLCKYCHQLVELHEKGLIKPRIIEYERLKEALN